GSGGVTGPGEEVDGDAAQPVVVREGLADNALGEVDGKPADLPAQLSEHLAALDLESRLGARQDRRRLGLGLRLRGVDDLATRLGCLFTSLRLLSARLRDGLLV